jgi:4-hydroxy-tetrahydrodipicolinate synthase
MTEVKQADAPVIPSPAGIVTALVTPFDEDERLDYGSWQAIIDTLIAEGVHGLFVAGGQGEFFALDDAERIEVLRFCRKAGGGRVPVYGNVGCITTRASIRLAQVAEGEGIDYLVAITPYYLKPSEDELVAHYVAICRAVRRPVFAYSIPERTGLTLTPSAIARISAQCGNFAGLKDSTGDLGQLPALLEAAPDRRLVVFMGRDHLILDGLKLGCAGAVTACSNVAPRLFVDLYESFRRGDLETAARLQALVNPLRKAFSLHTFPSVVKEAMELAGLPAGPCRAPVGRMTAGARDELARVLEELRKANYLPEPSWAQQR